ncbi:hypothetical protein L1887_18292 [Cichorium endivia]|nr:hypothetical protein L1887_18292 [Cichorium endivia]
MSKSITAFFSHTLVLSPSRPHKSEDVLHGRGKRDDIHFYGPTLIKDDGLEVVSGRSRNFGQHQISRRVRLGRYCKTSESDSTSIKSMSDRETRDVGRRKDDEVVFPTSSVTVNETTPESLPPKVSSTNEAGKFWKPHSDIGFFKYPITKVLKLGGHNPEGKE